MGRKVLTENRKYKAQFYIEQSWHAYRLKTEVVTETHRLLAMPSRDSNTFHDFHPTGKILRELIHSFPYCIQCSNVTIINFDRHYENIERL
jgi:hypothetical protein